MTLGAVILLLCDAMLICVLGWYCVMLVKARSRAARLARENADLARENAKAVLENARLEAAGRELLGKYASLAAENADLRGRIRRMEDGSVDEALRRME